MSFKTIVSVFLIILVALIVLQYYIGAPKTKNEWYTTCHTPTEKEEYTICCRENNTGIDCSDNEILQCGDEIRILIKLDFKTSEYYLCANRDALDDGWGGAYHYNNDTKILECVPGDVDILYWRGKIPYKEGNFVIVDFYFVPSSLDLEPENSLEYENLLQELGNYEKIIEIHREVQC